MLVRDVMGPSMGGADAGETLRDAWARLEALDLDPLPVVENGKVIGGLSRAEIRRRLAVEGIAAGGDHVRDVMSQDIAYPAPDQEADEALAEIQASFAGAERVPVVDRDGTLAGIVTVRALRQRDPDADDGVAAVQSVNSIDSLVSYEDDRVDYEVDGSFPASDPPSESSAGVTAPTRPSGSS